MKNIFVFFILLPFTYGSLVHLLNPSTKECFVPGECVDSFSIAIQSAVDEFECLGLCKDQETCEWFTFFPSFQTCQLFRNCTTIDVETCNDCLSGERGCELAEAQCWLEGECEGNTITAEEAESEVECLRFCKSVLGCKWFTFFQPGNVCFLFSECETLDETCEGCISGERRCKEDVVTTTTTIGTTTSTTTVVPDAVVDCNDLMGEGTDYPAVMDIVINYETYQVNCLPGGWTVFQSRGQFGNPADFFSVQKWVTYQAGFGVPGKEHWLGLDNLYYLTNYKNYTLRVTLREFSGREGSAQYSTFKILDNTRYTLRVSQYNGTAGDSLAYHDGSAFSTIDRDNDSSGGSCASSYQGAYWYKSCYYSNLNGLNCLSGVASDSCIQWNTFSNYGLASVEMAIKDI